MQGTTWRLSSATTKPASTRTLAAIAGRPQVALLPRAEIRRQAVHRTDQIRDGLGRCGCSRRGSRSELQALPNPIPGRLPVQHQHLADVLHWLRLQPGADFGQGGFASDALEAGGPHFDQFMRGERAVDLGQCRLGQPFFTKMEDRIEGVGARLERFSVARFDQSQAFRPSRSYLWSRRNSTSRTSPSPENCTDRMYSTCTALYMR